jgi:hypothetical protein
MMTLHLSQKENEKCEHKMYIILMWKIHDHQMKNLKVKMHWNFLNTINSYFQRFKMSWFLTFFLGFILHWNLQGFINSFLPNHMFKDINRVAYQYCDQ